MRSLIAACLALVALALPAWSGEPARFERAAFEAAQAAGQPVLVVVSAPWCPICKAQKPILARFGSDPRFGALTMFEIDFDTRKDELRRFDARSQSTLILFKNGKEVARSVGETQPEWIEAFLEKAL